MTKISLIINPIIFLFQTFIFLSLFIRGKIFMRDWIRILFCLPVISPSQTSSLFGRDFDCSRLHHFDMNQFHMLAEGARIDKGFGTDATHFWFRRFRFYFGWRIVLSAVVKGTHRNTFRTHFANALVEINLIIIISIKIDL